MPIRILTGFTPGGLPDMTARLIGPRLLEVWKQQVVVDNRPGAGGIIATDLVAKANPDGYTLLSVSSSHVATPAVRAKLPFRHAQRFCRHHPDFARGLGAGRRACARCEVGEI